MTVKLGNYYFTKVQIEDENGEIQETRLKVARLSPEAHANFEVDMKRLNDAPSNRMLGGRRQDGDEQERDEKGNYKISDYAVTQRRIAELTGDALAAYKAADADDETWARNFLTESVRAHVRFVDGAVEKPDGSPCVTGDDIVEMFGGSYPELRQFVMAVWNENTMSAAQKKTSRLLSDLTRSLAARTQAQAGTSPAPTVASAESTGSVETAAATA